MIHIHKTVVDAFVNGQSMIWLISYIHTYIYIYMYISENSNSQHLLLIRCQDGEGNGNPVQCSCLENPRDGGAQWAAVYGVAQSRTRLKRLSSSSSTVNFKTILFFFTIIFVTNQRSDYLSILCNQFSISSPLFHFVNFFSTSKTILQILLKVIDTRVFTTHFLDQRSSWPSYLYLTDSRLTHTLDKLLRWPWSNFSVH